MPTVVRARISANELALSSTLSALPSIEIETERIVKGGESVVMPLLWVRNATAEEFEAACKDDPSVDETSLLGDFDDELLYRMHWVDQIGLLLQMLTNGEATILDAFAHDGDWRFRILYPSRDKLNETKSFCSQHNLGFNVEAIREMDGEPAGRYALTTGQYEALVTAAEKGYFKIPRDVNLEELANELGISHQALSERLRRGTEALVEDTLQPGIPEQSKHPPDTA